uniref:Uncharacterized protein n=1 Tax=Arundo donax TaxID=35708 RepID=A0A0A9BVD4_ARUDO
MKPKKLVSQLPFHFEKQLLEAKAERNPLK